MNLKRQIIKILMPVVKIYWRIVKPKTFGVKVLVTHPEFEGKILLVLHTYGSRTLWNIPGGGYNPKKETVIAAGVREVREELGVELLAPREIGSYETSSEGKHDTVTIVTGTLNPQHNFKLGHEVVEVLWEDHAITARRGDDVARVARRAIEYRYR